MIIARSPLRISLGGGGTDLPSYYEKFGGFLVAAAIDKYVYVTVHKNFTDDYILKYSKLERVKSVEEIEHPIIREALWLTGHAETHLEIVSIADIPAGTGLGSSGSFTTALLKALHTHRRHFIHPRELAEQACHIEIDRLGAPVGKQDQYIAAFGGITAFTIERSGAVQAQPVFLADDVQQRLEESLLLFFTGYSRSAAAILSDQDKRSKTDDQGMIEGLHTIKDLGYRSLEALAKGDLQALAGLMNEHWDWKRRRSPGMSNERIDYWYRRAMSSGALAGKLVGAGGGGFLAFLAEDRERLRAAMREEGLQEIRFRFDYEGTKVIAG